MFARLSKLLKVVLNCINYQYISTYHTDLIKKYKEQILNYNYTQMYL